MRLSEQIKSKAAELGFTQCGLTEVQPLDPTSRERFMTWLEADYHGEMGYLFRSSEKRLDPGKVLDGARSLISLLMNYHTPEQHSTDSLTGVISRYAWGRDYHRVIEEKLKELIHAIFSCTTHSALGYVDTGPVLDKWWAQKAGLGWVGKNANFINPEIGSWVFVGEILTTFEFEKDEYDRPFEPPRHRRQAVATAPSESVRARLSEQTLCGTCTRCIDVCPTGAIVAPYVVDSRRCISYLTIELRGPIPRALRPLIGNRIFGCDDCQDVCPWNRFAVPTREPEFHPSEGNLTPQLIQWMGMTKEEFDRRFKQSPIRRAKYAGFLRNVAVALGNSRSPLALPALRRALSHREALVRQHAAWALGALGTTEARETLQAHQPTETHPEVSAEIECSLSVLLVSR